MEYRPKELYQIVDQYEKEGYIEVPGYYSEKGRHCRLCGWENDSEFPKTCPKCKAQYEQDSVDKQFPLNFTWLSIEDWLILQAIEHQIKIGEQPYATLEEFAENIRDRDKHSRQWTAENRAKKIQAPHRNDSRLYQHK